MSRLLIALAALLSCSQAELAAFPDEPPPAIDDRLAIHGEVCTESPEDVSYPTRVLFLVDASESMAANDPPDPITGQTRREAAIAAVLEDLFARGADVRVSLIRFSSEAQPLTSTTDADGIFESYFTDDLDHALSMLPFLAETDRTTNYLNAFSEAYSEIRDEIDRSELSSVALSAYHVVLISDGIPDAEGSESDADILGTVDALIDLTTLFDIGEISVNTALIASGDAEVDAVAEDLLREVAEHGNGHYRTFEVGETLSFLDLDLVALKRIFTLKSLIVQNLNARVVGDLVLADSDGDGLSDYTERLLGSNPAMADTDGDGCRDGVESLIASSGLDINTSDCNCYLADYCFDVDGDGLCDSGCEDADGDNLCDCIDEDDDGICDPSNYSDLDRDGLSDCEEAWVGSNNNGADSDSDGLTDDLELRFGTSPDLSDAEDDLDWDRVSNGDEIRSATDPLAISETRRARAYQYELDEDGMIGDGQTCYGFEVSNITLTETAPADSAPMTPALLGQGFSGSNRSLIFVGDVPLDNQEGHARIRVACVEARFQREGNYRNPPSGIVEVQDRDFVLLSDFDADQHCIPPEGRR